MDESSRMRRRSIKPAPKSVVVFRTIRPHGRIDDELLTWYFARLICPFNVFLRDPLRPDESRIESTPKQLSLSRHRARQLPQCNRGHRRCVRFDTTISAKKPVPEEIDHCEIMISITVVDEMELLLSPKPIKSTQP